MRKTTKDDDDKQMQELQRSALAKNRHCPPMQMPNIHQNSSSIWTKSLSP